jgi:hypothetical protein
MTKTSWDILQCPLAKRCRARWERLEPVQGNTGIRFCAACERSVFLCQTDEELSQHSALGRCVALEILNIGVAHLGESLPIRYQDTEMGSRNDDADP